MRSIPILGLFLLLAACTRLPPTITPEPSPEVAEAPTLDPSAPQLQLEVLNSQLSLGEERIAFRIRDGSGRTLTGSDVKATVEMLALRADGARSQVASGNSEYFGSTMPGGGSWVTYNKFDSSGQWVLRVKASRSDGWSASGEVPINIEGRTELPRVGTRPPADGGEGALAGSSTARTSDPQPDPELYGTTVAQALESGKPTVIYLGSPANCSSDACSATLAEIKATRPKYAGRVNFIHIETHELANPATPSAEARAWHLPSEPWTFILDSSGRITNRIEGPIDRTELGLLLDRVLSGGA